MKLLFGMSWLLPIIGAVGVIGTTPVVSEAPVTITDKVEALLWMIGILVTGLGILIGVVITLLKSIKKQDSDDHTRIEKAAVDDLKAVAQRFINDSHDQWLHINDVEKIVAQLLGEHKAAFSLKGCAWEPEALKEVLRGILVELASEEPNPFNHAQRQCEKPGYCMKSEMPKNQTGGD